MAPSDTSPTRKERELAEREQLILDVARDLLLERGYLGLNMDRVAAAIEYSKGTIYQHFSSKEDLIVALAAQTIAKRVELFARAAAFAGRPREKMQAIGIADEIFFRLYPQHTRSEQIIHAASVQSKADQERLDVLAQHKRGCFGILIDIVADAVQAGDLALAGSPPAAVTVGLWSMSFGAHFLSASEPALAGADDDSYRMLERNQHALLDGYGWQPLSAAYDHTATRRRILAEVFADEAHAAGLVPGAEGSKQ